MADVHRDALIPRRQMDVADVMLRVVEDVKVDVDMEDVDPNVPPDVEDVIQVVLTPVVRMDVLVVQVVQAVVRVALIRVLTPVVRMDVLVVQVVQAVVRVALILVLTPVVRMDVLVVQVVQAVVRVALILVQDTVMGAMDVIVDVRDVNLIVQGGVMDVMDVEVRVMQNVRDVLDVMAVLPDVAEHVRPLAVQRAVDHVHHLALQIA